MSSLSHMDGFQLPESQGILEQNGLWHTQDWPSTLELQQDFSHL